MSKAEVLAEITRDCMHLRREIEEKLADLKEKVLYYA
jgi:hypothetical protein